MSKLELNSTSVLATIKHLGLRIEERFPGSGLYYLAEELFLYSKDINQDINNLARPIIWIKLINIFLITIIVLAGIGTAYTVHLPGSFHFFDIIQTIEAGINDIVLIGAGIFFLISLEQRVKRKRALKSLHKLRSIVHVIDMHQLTKDPAKLLSGSSSTKSSPKIEYDHFMLSRYLDYCSEMLSLVGKLAALYMKESDDQTVLESVNEIESLATSLSGKIWQKLIILHNNKEAVSIA